jgi:hypothetical protein
MQLLGQRDPMWRSHSGIIKSAFVSIHEQMYSSPTSGSSHRPRSIANNIKVFAARKDGNLRHRRRPLRLRVVLNLSVVANSSSMP